MAFSNASVREWPASPTHYRSALERGEPYAVNPATMPRLPKNHAGHLTRV